MEKTFRNYNAPDVKASVREHYRKMRSYQTVDYVRSMHQKYLRYDRPMDLWEAMEHLNALIDVSDPDLDLPNIQHLIQSAEALREDKRPDWMQLVGLIHDLGKLMYLWGSDEDGTSQNEQWGLVGDVFAVGCAIPESCVYPEFNALNPDMANPEFNSELGMYEQGCGLDALTLAWGHDEYLYQVLKHHKPNNLPEAGMVMIRYHSFYPWHSGGSYQALLTAKDEEYLQWIRDFNRYDLYTKSETLYDLNKVRDYYKPIADHYLGTGPIYW